MWARGTRPPPLNLSDDILTRAARTTSVVGADYGKAVAEEVKEISRLMTARVAAQAPRAQRITIPGVEGALEFSADITIASRPTNIGVIRRFLGSPSKWEKVGGPVGQATGRIVWNAIDREMLSHRLTGEWREILKEAGGLIEQGAKGAAAKQRKRIEFGKLLDTVFEPEDLGVAVPENMQQAFALIRGRLLADREALRLTVGGAADWGIDAYLPHVFVGDYIIRDAAGATRAVVRMPDIKRTAADILKAEPGAQLTVIPKEFAFPQDLGGFGLPAKQYFAFTNRAAEALSLSPEQVRQLVTEGGVVRVGARQKFFAHTQQRTANLEGFEADPFVALDIYSRGVGRKLAFHDFEAKTQAIIEGMELAAGAPRAVAASTNVIKEYVDRVMGRPTQMQEQLRATVQNIANRVSEAGFERIGIFIEQRGDPARLSSRLSQWESIARLGYSPTSWFLNLSQTAVNTATAIGWTPTMRAIRLLSDRSQRTQTDALLRALDIDLRVPLSAAGDMTSSVVGDVSVWHPLYLFNRAETANRSIAGVAKYLEELKAGRPQTVALENAKRFITETQFEYSFADTPMLMQGPLGSTAFQFKKFLTKELEFLAGLSPKQASRLVVNIQLVGGLSALMSLPPGLLLDALTGKFTGETLTERVQEKFPRASRGIPGLLGVDFGGSVAIGLPRDVGDVFGPAVSDVGALLALAPDAFDIMTSIPGLQDVNDKIRTQFPLTPQDRARALRQLLPVLVRRVGDAAEIVIDEKVTIPGRATEKFRPENPASEALLTALGFRSLERAQEQEVTTINNRINRQIRAADQVVVQEWAIAHTAGDFDKAAKILRDAARRGLIITSAQLQRALEDATLGRTVRGVKRTPIEAREEALRRSRRFLPRR